MPRPAWSTVPPAVRDWAEATLSGEITGAVSQAGGFSPGTADIVTTAVGRRAFIKAAGRDLNEHTPGIHRTEASISRRLPRIPELPTLIADYDDGDWVALAFEVVDGIHPQLPWSTEQLRSVLDACVALRSVPVPAELPTAVAVFDNFRTAWLRLDEQEQTGPEQTGLHPRDVATLAALSASPIALDGDHLAQFDLRADNVLLRPDGSAVIIDWPWAARGAGWIDAVCLLFNVLLYDPTYPVDDELRHPAFDGATAHDIDAVLALLAGFFLQQSLEPPQKGVESV